ncbi:MAG TPA: archease [bacterium]|nr:archease [bacterium]HPP13452.1 archease [bacterium]
MFKLLEHPADVRVKVTGRSLEELFLSASQALISLLKPVKQEPAGKTVLKLKASSIEELLVRFLGELIYLVEVHQKIPAEATAKIKKKSALYHLEATIELVRGQASREIKAATYHGLKVVQERGRYSCFIIFDV